MELIIGIIIGIVLVLWHKDWKAGGENGSY